MALRAPLGYALRVRSLRLHELAAKIGHTGGVEDQAGAEELPNLENSLSAGRGATMPYMHAW